MSKVLASGSLTTVRLRRTALVSLILLLPCRVSLWPDLINDPDLWWHLRTGDWVLQHGTVPRVDTFSALAGHPWVAYSWGFEIALSGLYRWLGLLGPIVIQVALSIAIVIALLALLSRLQPSFPRVAALAGLGAVALGPMFAIRPWLFTILFLLMELIFLYQARNSANPAWLWLLPALFCCWANIHIQFIYGLVVLLFVAADHWLSGLLKRWGIPTSEAFAGLSPRALSATFGASVIATFINPYGARLYQVVYEYARHSSAVLDYVDEFRAMDFRRPAHFLVLALLIAGVATIARRREIRIFEVEGLLFATFLAFRMRRDIWILVIMALVVLASSERGYPTIRLRPRALDGILGTAIVLLGLLITMHFRGIRNEHLNQVVADHFPQQATEFARRCSFEGPLYNDFNWGGYLIWRLPQFRVSMDGRTNLHGESRILRSAATWGGSPSWATDPELANARLVIGPVNSPLASLLRFDPRFRLVYEDKLAVVFVARQSAARDAALAPQSATATLAGR